MKSILKNVQKGYYLYQWKESLLFKVVCWDGPSGSIPGDVAIKLDDYETTQFNAEGETFLAKLAKSIQYSTKMSETKKDEKWIYKFHHPRDIKDEEAVSAAFTEYRIKANK